MEKVRKGEGIICVCAECKKVIKVLKAPAAGTEALLSHGICPACAERLYGEYLRKKRSEPLAET